MPLFRVENLKERLQGGAKTDKFTMLIHPPVGAPAVGFTNDDYCLVKNINFPSKILGGVEAWVQGRKLIIPGDIEFGDNNISWTMYNTPNHDIRQKLLDWMDYIDDYVTNWHTSDPWHFTTKIDLVQMDGVGNSLKTYTLHYAFPGEIGDISADASQINTIQEFTASFKYSYFTTEKHS